MGQLITTILSVIVLLFVPVGIVQLHIVAQMRAELHELSFATVKFISNHGGRSEAEVLESTRAFIEMELASKRYELKEDELKLAVSRTKAADEQLWSHEDEFTLRMEMPFPRMTELFPEWDKPIVIVRTGTINVMDYDL
ncbi:hypothetical protein [Brevibacillus fulvus]|uniref:Uncharacterized protein n=1 Tax=Brevibacillus fulvus TaxID=1125967 RepID=A0A938Y1P3_9BACL|nr:hypothetical protein [Brevibacillus fulvus]MBM7592314.1 hypothetical protein [Brevibacillus fulvus]